MGTDTAAHRALTDVHTMEGTVTDEEQTGQDEPVEEKTGQDEPVEEKHSFKEDLREGVAKVVGIAVEAGSMLSGHSGEMVSAEREVAEADTEKFLDRIDGEG
jgi:hypothetical protein